jgi:hypothetical protein
MALYDYATYERYVYMCVYVEAGEGRRLLKINADKFWEEHVTAASSGSNRSQRQVLGRTHDSDVFWVKYVTTSSG